MSASLSDRLDGIDLSHNVGKHVTASIVVVLKS